MNTTTRPMNAVSKAGPINPPDQLGPMHQVSEARPIHPGARQRYTNRKRATHRGGVRGRTHGGHRACAEPIRGGEVGSTHEGAAPTTSWTTSRNVDLMERPHRRSRSGADLRLRTGCPLLAECSDAADEVGESFRVWGGRDRTGIPGMAAQVSRPGSRPLVTVPDRLLIRGDATSSGVIRRPLSPTRSAPAPTSSDASRVRLTPDRRGGAA